MAERRMFSKKIIDSDAFLDMPVTARLLYYDLAMRADDDGFVNAPKRIMRVIGASQDDLSILVAKKFIIPFDKGIVVIKHWRIHNYIRKDTYNGTLYIDEMAHLELDENKAYKLKDDTEFIESRRVVDEPSTQVSIGKDSIDKDRLDNKYSVHFEAFWKAYPRKKEKSKAYKCYQARLKDGFSEDELLNAAKNYAEECEREHREERYIKLGATFLSSNTPFVDYLKGGESDAGHANPDEEHAKWVEAHREQLEAVRRDMFGV